MYVLATPGTQGLVVLNIVLGLLCLGAVLAVTVAAALDLLERRRWRALVPPCWPPPGVDPDSACLIDPPRPARRPAGARPSPAWGGEAR